MLKIGLTGGIGSGKSTVAHLFSSAYNIPIIDADIIAHQLVKPEQPALLSLKQLFGNSIFNNDNCLDRNKLRELVFSAPEKRKQLEQLLHPLIYQQMQLEFEQQSAAYCLLCIPLLMETSMVSFVDRILAIDRSVKKQIERVQARDNLSNERVLSIINSQVTREYRLSHTDDIIDNSNSTSQLAEQVKKLHNHYLLLSNC